jgi:diketogulonate reductase-like aldo/keto reductase
LLSRRDPSTFSSPRSANFAAAAAARSLQQIRAGSDMVIIDKIFINNHDCAGASDSHDRSHLKLDLEKFDSYLIQK